MSYAPEGEGRWKGCACNLYSGAWSMELSLEFLSVHPVFSLDTAFPQVRESDYLMNSFKITECPDS